MPAGTRGAYGLECLRLRTPNPPTGTRHETCKVEEEYLKYLVID